MQTYSGKRFDLLDPRIEDVDVIHVAHSLSGCNRFVASLGEHYSVAQHSLMVADLVAWKTDDGCGGDSRLVYEALMHDAAEAYTGDISRPLKNVLAMSDEVAALLRRIESVVAVAFAVPYPHSDAVRWADNIACAIEARDGFLGGPVDNWHSCLGEIPPGWSIERVLDPIEAETQFLSRYSEFRNI